MTLETANRIVLEQGEKTNKEARAVVRGGMVICELTVDGRRTYPWIKVYPTKTDNESSIEQALEMRHAKKTSPSMKILSKQEPVLVPSKEPEVVPVQVPEEKSTIEEKSFSIYSLISKGKQKLLELWKEIDEMVVE